MSKHLLCLASLIITPFTFAATVRAPNADVKYEGIDQKQADAIAQTVSAARKIYVDDFGFDMPENIFATVAAKAGLPTRLYNDGMDRLILSIASAAMLNRPQKSGVFNLYGICHELGHLAMYRLLKDHDWLSGAGAEGWAHYAGSLLVDRVYASEGEKLWADPYDYRQDGLTRLKKQLAAASADPTTKAAGQWMELEKIIGQKEFPKLFSAWQSAQIDLANPAPAVSRVLFELKSDKKPALEKWWQSASPLLIQKRDASTFKTQNIAANKLTGKPTEIALDDGTDDGKSSIAGGGHARKFTAPGAGEWYLTRIDIRAARYGPPQAPSTQFEIALCDSQNRPIASWKKGYAMVPHAAQLDWIHIDIPPTRVPGEFNICLEFKPTGSSGIYMAYDSSTRGNSRVATPGQEGNAFAKGDWMIRPHLDQPKEADALK
ncbi:MAG TPA: hypothetical protein VGP99_09210 [Tepidisphaeraceae bacterium]|jgi:hypothetical protein|nr:hypothetical protein [Tepidisphaeraceae bacterium]